MREGTSKELLTAHTVKTFEMIKMRGVGQSHVHMCRDYEPCTLKDVHPQSTHQRQSATQSSNASWSLPSSRTHSRENSLEMKQKKSFFLVSAVNHVDDVDELAVQILYGRWSFCVP